VGAVLRLVGLTAELAHPRDRRVDVLDSEIDLNA